MGDEYRNDRPEGRVDGDEKPVESARQSVDTELVQRLGEASEGFGRVGLVNLMAISGVSVPEGVVLTREFHRRFLETGGISEAIRECAGGRGDVRRRARELRRALRREYGRVPVEGGLNRVLCDAILGLGARTVAVISEDVSRTGLGTIPEARAAVCEAWLSLEGLRRQIEAVSRGEEIPTWPVLIQREVYCDPRQEECSAGYFRSSLRVHSSREESEMNVLPRVLLLATDGSQDAVLAARTATDLSNRSGAELNVVHVGRSISTHVQPTIAPERFSLLFAGEAQKLLDEQVESIKYTGGKVSGVHLKLGNPSDEILELAEDLEADLIIMGSRGLGPVDRLVVGSVSEAVVHRAVRPVLVVRGGEDAWPPSSIVVGEDSSPEAERAAEISAGLGKLLGADVLLVRAYPDLSALPGDPTVADSQVSEVLHRAEEDLEKRAAELARILGSKPRTRVALGDATALVLGTAREVGPAMISVGSRGLGVIDRARHGITPLGSVSTKILRVAEGPVLVYPRETA